MPLKMPPDDLVLESPTRRSTLLGLKAELEAIEAKARVCYLEVVELLCEEDKEKSS